MIASHVGHDDCTADRRESSLLSAPNEVLREHGFADFVEAQCEASARRCRRWRSNGVSIGLMSMFSKSLNQMLSHVSQNRLGVRGSTSHEVQPRVLNRIVSRGRGCLHRAVDRIWATG